MADIRNEVLYEELLKLDERMAESEAVMADLVAFMKDMNRELAEGQARTEALKRKLFKDRFDAQGLFVG
ncbi:hypothetical protein [Rhizobium sp. SAFR-030]|uniref:hypothetical protein n=1 Tax=Rhizobium sp. SAFR-030 TaxID=3387277 RepID=UPI003F80327E